MRTREGVLGGLALLAVLPGCGERISFNNSTETATKVGEFSPDLTIQQYFKPTSNMAVCIFDSLTDVYQGQEDRDGDSSRLNSFVGFVSDGIKGKYKFMVNGTPIDLDNSQNSQQSVAIFMAPSYDAPKWADNKADYTVNQYAPDNQRVFLSTDPSPFNSLHEKFAAAQCTAESSGATAAITGPTASNFPQDEKFQSDLNKFSIQYLCDSFGFMVAEKLNNVPFSTYKSDTDPNRNNTREYKLSSELENFGGELGISSLKYYTFDQKIYDKVPPPAFISP